MAPDPDNLPANPPVHPPDSHPALYLFCVIGAEAPIPASEGLEPGHPLRVVREGDLQALTCVVQRDDWEGAAGEAHLGDLSWLGPRAVQHEWVVERAVAQASAALPLRFGCLFSDEERLRAWLRQQGAAISTFLRECAGQQEWSLKGWYDPARGTDALLQADPRYQQLPTAPGARYLREQKLRQEAQRGLRRLTAEISARVGDCLAPACERLRTLQALPGSASGLSEEVACHHAALLLPEQLPDLRAAAERVGAEFAAYGLRLELSGPWPLYSFCPALSSATPSVEPQA